VSGISCGEKVNGGSGDGGGDVELRGVGEVTPAAFVVFNFLRGTGHGRGFVTASDLAFAVVVVFFVSLVVWLLVLVGAEVWV
jgi:hypothetical protein